MKKLAILFAFIIFALAPVGTSAPDADERTSPQTEDVTACVGAPTERETDRGTDSDETSAPETSAPETTATETSICLMRGSWSFGIPIIKSPGNLKR